jgi:hypothetical protein
MKVVLSVLAMALAISALIVAYVIEPPLLAWVGFAIVSIIVLSLGALTPLAFERTRVTPQRPAVANDQLQRLLVVADSRCRATVLRDVIVAYAQGAVAVHLVVPVRVSRLHFVTDDESDEWREAARSMLISIALLHERGVPATGSVGSDKPLESLTDALGSFPATGVLLATPPEEDSYWLERDLLAKARRLTNVPVTQVVVPSRSTIGPRTAAAA